MEGAKNIEALTLCFTAGVVAGTLVPGTVQGVFPALVLLLALMPTLSRRALPFLFLAILLAGWVSASLASMDSYSDISPLERLAETAVGRVREFIDALPFRHPETAALLKALLTGDRSGLSSQTVAVFRKSGASHLLALSGLHMGILYLIFDWATKLGGKAPAIQKTRAALLISAAGFFTLMAGAGPSLVRAFFFILLNEVLALSGRRQKATTVFCLALLFQLILQPGVILSLGFQLSYLALAGILLLYPTLESWYPDSSRFNPLRRIWQASALSISCQVFTAPLVWIRFHTFPSFFLLTNLLAIPVTTILMGAAVLTLGLSALGICPELLYTTTDGLSRLLVNILEIIATLS